MVAHLKTLRRVDGSRDTTIRGRTDSQQSFCVSFMENMYINTSTSAGLSLLPDEAINRYEGMVAHLKTLRMVDESDDTTIG